MKNWTVKHRIILGFSAVILITITLSALAFVRLRSIGAQAANMQKNWVPMLNNVGRLHAVSIETYTSVQQHILENDPARMAQIMFFIQQKTQERLDLLHQEESLFTSDKDKELYVGSREAPAARSA